MDWTEACQDSFVRLKEALVCAPVLAYADFSRPFQLYTDASLEGLGAVLAQEQDGQERVVAFASRSLHLAERNDQNYSSFKLELLALKWAITEKFKDYLWGATIEAFTDNSPLVHLATANLGAVEQRWVNQLANYRYTIKFRSGRANKNADALSRLPSEMAEAMAGVVAVVAFGPSYRGPPPIFRPVACLSGLSGCSSFGPGRLQTHAHRLRSGRGPLNQ